MFVRYCIVPMVPVRYKHVSTGGNRALPVENVDESVNSRTVNDRLCMFNILNPGLSCKQCSLNVCPYQCYQLSDQQGCRNLYYVTFFFLFWLILKTPQKKSYSESVKTRSESKDSFLKTLPLLHHPTTP